MHSKPFLEALQFAALKHGGQYRKSTRIPYISHPMAVSSIVMEFGGTENQSIAALLHDVIEDCDVTAQELEAWFGAEVAQIVAQCLDSSTHPKPPFRERKERYIVHVEDVGKSTLLV